MRRWSLAEDLRLHPPDLHLVVPGRYTETAAEALREKGGGRGLDARREPRRVVVPASGPGEEGVPLPDLHVHVPCVVGLTDRVNARSPFLKRPWATSWILAGRGLAGGQLRRYSPESADRERSRSSCASSKTSATGTSEAAPRPGPRGPGPPTSGGLPGRAVRCNGCRAAPALARPAYRGRPAWRASSRGTA